MFFIDTLKTFNLNDYQLIFGHLRGAKRHNHNFLSNFFLLIIKQINTSQIVHFILTIKYGSDVFYSSAPKRFEQSLQLQRIKVLK